jgi:hypothetical protein
MSELLIQQDRLDDAEALISRGLKRWGDDLTLTSYKLQLAISREDDDEIEKLAGRLLNTFGTNEDALFVAALGQVLSGRGNWERTARAFLKTPHQYTGYVAILLASMMSGQTQEDAHEILENQWSIFNHETRSKRLEQGDLRAWQEMLIGYYLDKGVTHTDIILPFESDKAFVSSPLQKLPFPRTVLQCEAYLYVALKFYAKDDWSQMFVYLQKVIETKSRSNWEYHIAKYLKTKLERERRDQG